MTNNRVVVDTNVISYIFKNHSLDKVYDALLIGKQVIISFQTQAELQEWTLTNGWGTVRRQALSIYLQRYTIIHSDEFLVARWGEVRNACQRAGRRIDPADAWIAATALALRCPLVTHNAADFAGVPNLTIITETRP
ncbi:PIN domain-containing protein [Deinococcus sp.]|uniref:PIN domain-containing protein n=1 Tax=Deinococcus sp. TaxID=47478 RepID=UPI003B5B66A2